MTTTSHQDPVPVPVPATYYQRDWFSACQDAKSFYSTPVAWQLSGALDVDLLAGVLEDLMLRHAALRTAFRARGDDVDQLVWPRVQIDLRQVDLSQDPDPAEAARTRIVAEADRDRRLDIPPLWHGLVLRLAADQHVLALFIHHLVFDGWSHGILHDELVRCYRASKSGRAPRLPSLPAQLGDFAMVQRNHRDPQAEQWWRNQLHALPPLAPIPPIGGRFISQPIPAISGINAGSLTQLASDQGVSAGTALLAILAAARQPLVGDDLLIGVTRAGRDRPRSQRIVGPLLDHLPVRIDLSGRPGLPALLGRVHRAYREAIAHQLPLGLIRQVAPLDLSARGGRLHDIRFNYLPPTGGGRGAASSRSGELQIADWPMEPTRLAPRHTEDHPEVLPLSYVIRHGIDGELRGEICAHDQLHSRAQLAELADSFSIVATRLVAELGEQPALSADVA